jgi:hypothetical protein
MSKAGPVLARPERSAARAAAQDPAMIPAGRSRRADRHRMTYYSRRSSKTLLENFASDLKSAFGALDRGRDEISRFGRADPARDLHPLAFLQILIVAEKMGNLLAQDGR